MGYLEKIYSILIMISVAAGLLLGQISGLSVVADAVIVPLLMLMLLFTFIQVPIQNIKQSFANRKFTITSIIMNFILTPVLAWLLASVFLADHPALWIGFIMLMVTPCTDWYIVFTGIAKGNVALSASILPLNLLLQLMLLPVYFYIFAGTAAMVDLQLIVESIVLVLLIPLLLAYGIRAVLHRRAKELKKSTEKMDGLPIIFLCLAIVAMFTSQGEVLLANLDLLLLLLLPILAFFITNFLLGRVVGRMLKFNHANTASLNLTTLARNSPIALALAITAFPHEPLIPLVLIIGPLVELPLLAIISQIILRLGSR
ncbi:arsenic resistance protein [Virgibacillus kimchii]